MSALDPRDSPRRVVIEPISEQPLVFVIDDYLLPSEARHIVDLANASGFQSSETHRTLKHRHGGSAGPTSLIDADGDGRLTLAEMRLTIEQMVDASDGIVRGKVTEVWTEPDPDTQMIWTHAQIEVSSVLKGEEAQVIVLEQPGGSWGTREAMVEGVARFSVGEEGYFFVEHLRDRSVPVGMFQGKFNVVMDPYTRTELAHRFQVHAAQTFDHRFIPLPPEAKRMQADSFEDRIEDRLEAGWEAVRQSRSRSSAHRRVVSRRR